MPSGDAAVAQDAAGDTEELDRVVAGLQGPPREIAPKYFYDARGSALFEEITKLPEYYLTRCELEILEEHGAEMAGELAPDAALIELGVGSPDKVRHLLAHWPELAMYVPVDISEAALIRASNELREEFPDLRIDPIQADFTEPLQVEGMDEASQRVLFYPGSTIGNLDPRQAEHFLTELHDTHLRRGDALLLGADLQKDPGVLHAAYNDREGVTAEFNKNVLLHLNRRFGGDLDPDLFSHYAYYDAEKGCIEMHLRALETHTATLGGHVMHFEMHETIHTESSWKYTRHRMQALAERAGFIERKYWTDRRAWFGVWLFDVC